MKKKIFDNIIKYIDKYRNKKYFLQRRIHMKNNKIKKIFWTDFICNSYGISFGRHNSDCWS